MFPGLISVVLRNELTTIYESLIPEFASVILKYGLDDPRNPFVPYGGSVQPKHLDYKNGGQMRFRGLDKPEKRLGPSVDIIYINQAEQITLDAFSKMFSRLRNEKQVIDGVAYHQIILDMNPQGPRNWAKVWLDEKQIPMVNFWLKDNPKWYDPETDQWTPAGERYHDRLKQLPYLEYRRGYLGLWEAAEGVVYKSFRMQDHTRVVTWDEIPADYSIRTSRDYGTTRSSPFAHDAFAVSPNEDRIIGLPNCQIYKSGMDINDMVRDIKAVEAQIKDRLGRGVDKRISDHAGAEQLTLQNAGLPAMPGNKKVLDGISQVNVFLKENRVIFPATPGDLFHEPDSALIGLPQRGLEEFSEYVHKTDEQQERNPDTADIPQKGKDHWLDLLRYLIMDLNMGGMVESDFESILMQQPEIYGVDDSFESDIGIF